MSAATIPAYSPRTDTHYDSWNDLVKAESNGFVVVAVITRGTQTWPWVMGPYVDYPTARKAQSRIRRSFKKSEREEPRLGLTWKLHIKPTWKDGT